MTMRPLAWVVVGLAVVGLLLFLFVDDGIERRGAEVVEPWPEELDSEQDAPAPNIGAVADEDDSTSASPDDTNSRAAVAPAESTPPPSDAPAAELPRRLVSGLVLDTRGAPLADVELGWEEESGERARSDAAGAFELRFPAGVETSRDDPREVVVHDERFVALSTPVVGGDEERVVVVAAPAVAISGRVVNATGVPVSGTAVRLSLPESLLHDFPHPLDRSRPMSFGDTTSSAGSFDLGRIPDLPNASLVATRTGYAGRVVEPPRTDRSDLLLVLERLEGIDDAERRFATGVVLLPEGGPAVGALVALANASSRTDDEGTFSVPIEGDFEGPEPLVAHLTGKGPAVVPDFGELVRTAAPGLPPPLTLVLGETLAIRGVVRGEDGSPRANWSVSLADGTVVSKRVMPPRLAENMQRRSTQVKTDEDGRFELVDLRNRDYVLRAHDPDTLLQVRTDPIPAGTEDVVVLVRDDLLHARVAGRVLSRRGLPVGGASVAVGLYTSREAWGWAYVTGDPTTTDANGAFVLENVPREGAHLSVFGDQVIPEKRDLQAGDDVSDVELSVALRLHLRVTVVAENGGSPLFVEAFDADGNGLQLFRFQAGGWSSTGRQGLEAASGPDGPHGSVSGGEHRTGILSVSEDASLLRVFGGHETLAEHDLTLSPDVEVNDVRIELP